MCRRAIAVPEARSAEGCRAIRARFLLVSFLCANKEKKPACGAGNRK
jgi:hypothetical protein